MYGNQPQEPRNHRRTASWPEIVMKTKVRSLQVPKICNATSRLLLSWLSCLPRNVSARDLCIQWSVLLSTRPALRGTWMLSMSSLTVVNCICKWKHIHKEDQKLSELRMLYHLLQTPDTVLKPEASSKGKTLCSCRCQSQSSLSLQPKSPIMSSAPRQAHSQTSLFAPNEWERAKKKKG